MARLQLRVLAAMVPCLGLFLGSCDPASPREEGRAEDAGAEDAARDGGPDSDAAKPMTTAGTGAPWLPPIVIPTDGRFCALSVGAECDGREDCSGGQRCCATFNEATFSYDNIRCSNECRIPFGYEVCHPDGDDEPDCAEPGFVCRPSLIARFDFFRVCATPIPFEIESKSTGAPGRIACGSDNSCEVGSEKCCLRATFDFSRGATSFLEPFCTGIDEGPEACACDAEPMSGGDPKDAGVDPAVDASTIDASQPDPSDDDAG